MKTKLLLSFLLTAPFLQQIHGSERTLSSHDTAALELTSDFILGDTSGALAVEKTIALGEPVTATLLTTNQKIYCPICMSGDVVQNMTLSQCGHVFCTLCQTNTHEAQIANGAQTFKCSTCNQENPTFRPLAQILPLTESLTNLSQFNHVALKKSVIKLEHEVTKLSQKKAHTQLATVTRHNRILFYGLVGLGCIAATKIPCVQATLNEFPWQPLISSIKYQMKWKFPTAIGMYIGARIGMRLAAAQQVRDAQAQARFNALINNLEARNAAQNAGH